MVKKQRKVDANGNLQCSKCRELKPLGEFNRDKQSPIGYSYQCKACHQQTIKASYLKHKEKRLAANAEYRASNRERIRERDSEYYLTRKDYFRGKYTPEIGRADKAVQTAVRKGLLPSQRTMYCVQCHKTAEQYHHQSYLESDRLCVVPVCRSCHTNMNLNRHEGNRGLGVFPTSIGLVRIAIASTSR